MLVSSADDPNKVGYVDWNDEHSPDFVAGKVLPVTDKTGKVVGYWGVQVGWIDLQVKEAPGFDFATYRAQKTAELNAAMAAHPPTSK
jgi:hypothetical protein